MLKNNIEVNIMVKVTAMTCICADVFWGTDEIRPGGEALNFAAAACRYPQFSLSLIGAVGNDDAGKEIIRSVSRKPIDISNVHIIDGGVTASNMTYLTEKGDRYYKPDSWNGGVFQDFAISECDILKMKDSDMIHINFSCPNFYDVLSLKAECGYKLSVDFDVLRDFNGIEEVLENTDFFFISADDSVLPVLKSFSERFGGIFVGTLAEHGSRAYFHGNEYTAPAIPVKTIVDTTGCGDSYQAGFIGSYTLYHDIEKALNEGANVASETLSHIGGFEY